MTTILFLVFWAEAGVGGASTGSGFPLSAFFSAFVAFIFLRFLGPSSSLEDPDVDGGPSAARPDVAGGGGIPRLSLVRAASARSCSLILAILPLARPNLPHGSLASCAASLSSSLVALATVPSRLC